MNIDIERSLNADAAALGMDVDPIQNPGINTPPTMNNTETLPQGNPLASVPTTGFDLLDIAKPGGPINDTAMGASLAIVRSELFPVLTNPASPTSRIQNVLVAPTTMANCPVGFSNAEKELRAKLCIRLNLPTARDLNLDSFRKSELKLRFLIPIRDIWSNPDTSVYQWITLVFEVGKRGGGKQFGWRSRYCNPCHDDAPPRSKEGTA